MAEVSQLLLIYPSTYNSGIGLQDMCRVRDIDEDHTNNSIFILIQTSATIQFSRVVWGRWTVGGTYGTLRRSQSPEPVRTH